MAEPLTLDDLKAFQYEAPKYSEPAPKNKEPGAVSDMWSSFGSGAGNLVQGVGTFFGGSDSTLAELGSSAQEYWDERKSSKLRAKEAELSRKMRDKDVGFLETVGSVITDPYLAANMVAGSAPSMAVGMGAGGLVARGMATAGLMTTEAGALTSLGSRVAGGIGEGLTLVPDVYQNSQGSGVASAAGLALGVVTNMVTPGNLAGAAAAKMSGRVADDAVMNAFNKTALRRVGGAIAGEAAQEFGQEGGQAIIEQLGRGEQLDLAAAAKQGGVGAVLGGVMGGGMHPIVGEGAPKFKTQEERDTAISREREAIKLNERIAVVQAQADANPTDPVLKAELETLKATQQVNAAAGNLEASPTPENQQAHDLAIEQQQVASATLASAKDPANRDAYDTAETMRAALALKLAGPDGVKHAADVAAQASAAAIAAAPDLDNALGAFSSANRASSTLRVSATGMQNTVAGVAQAGEEILASHTVDVAAAEADLARTQHEATLRQHKEQQAAHKTQQAALKVNQERAKLGLPTINADMVPEATGAVEPTAPAPAVPARMDAAENVLIARLGPESAKQVFRSFTAMPTPDLQNLLRIGDRNGAMEADAREYLHALLESRGETVEGPAGGGFATPAQGAAFEMQRDGIQGREIPHTRVPNGNAAFQYAVGRTTEQGIDTVFRRRADEAGTYGGWRWENEISQLLPESQTAQPEPATSPGAPAELAATEQAMLDDGYDQVAVRGMYNLTNQELIDTTNDIGAKRSKREHAFEILQNRQNQYIMNRAQFNARENALENALAALAQVSGRTVDQISTMIAGASEQVLNNILNNPSVQYRNEQHALARIAVAYKNNTHLGNVDQFITTARRTAAQPEPVRAPAAPSAPAPEGRLMGRRRVEQDFEVRARTALNNGVLEKLGTFWNNVMRGRGQRVFNVNTRDLANVADGFSDLTQSQLNTLKDRYNAELNRQARQWALDNGQVVTMLTNPVISISRGSGRINIEVRALGRNGANPYMVPPDQARQVGDATISTRDGHMTTTGLEDAPGSSNLGYRIGAEIARMAGENVPASDALLTNNRMRRHMQSVYADSLFGPGHVSPMNAHGGMTPQGVPASVWGAANDVQRVGLNMMRAAHSITEGRAEGSHTAANFTENLQYNRDGKIVAVTEPKHARGWPVGTEVTDAMLLARLSEVDPVLNASAMGRSGAGGVGVDTAKLGIMTNTILAAIEANPTRAIPSWMLPKAKQIGRDIGGWMFSEAETTDTAATGVTQEQAEAEVRNMVGDNAAKVLLDSGVISFVESGEDLTGDTFSDKNGKVQGATMPDGKIVLVLGNLNEETLGPVLAHEALHSTIRNLLGEDTYSALMSRLDTMLKAGEGSQWVKDAEARVPPNTDPEQRLEEIAAYAVELDVRGGTRGNPLVRWARDFMSALRTAIIQNKALPEALRMWAMKNIQPQDLTRLAIAGLKRAAAQREAELKPNPKATSINVGLVVGMGETAETLSPEFVLAEIEKLGVKVGRNNVVDASYEHNGETINETTLVAELDRALTPAEVERLAINTKQQAIPQRVDGVGSLYGPKAAEWGGFNPHEFRELNGRRSDEANRESRARDWDAEIKALMEEHRNPKTTNARRSQINDELRSARMFQRADQEVRYAARTGQKFSVGASYGTPREGAVSVVGVHFSGAQRDMLSTSAYGTGIKGAEAERLSLPENRDIRSRTMFYVDEGKGVTPEQGVGAVGHQVRLNNLYDLRADALGLRNPDLSKMERDIVASGFDGYYAPNYRDMGQGVAVAIGKHSIPTEPYVPGEGAAPAPVSAANQYGEALAKSKLPGGAMLGREWLVAITGTEFDTPPVRAQLEQRQGERIYRDDLPRFNRGLRYSVAQEAATLEAPVAPELPGTFNILDIGRRTGIERAYEAVRRAIQDKHVTLRRIQQLAKIGSENIRMDTVGALDRLGSKLMAEQKRLVDEPLAKMENLLDKAGFTPDEGRAALDRLLIAAHVKEYNEHIAEINPVKFDAQGNYISGFDNDQHPGSGITSAEAAETLRELTSGNDPKTLALLAAQKEYRKMIADMQAFAVDRGLETQETIDSWNKKFPNYTPFNRELDIQENLSIGTIPGSQGFSLRSGIARRAMGSGAEIISPLASTMLWGLKTTTRGENAIVARTFLEFAKAFVPNYMSANGELRPMWKVNTVPNARVVKKMNVYRVSLPEGGLSPEFYSREQAENFGTMQQRAWQAANPGVSPRLSGINVEHMYDGEPQNRVVVQPEPNYQNKPNVMIVPVDGENQMIEFDQHSKDAMAIVEAFKGKATSGAATQTMNKVLTPFRMFSRWVMATSTGFNPVFAAFNSARDIQAAAINAGADKIPGWTAADSAKIAAGFIPAAKGIWKQLRAEFDQMHNNVEAPAPVAGSSADWMQRMVAAGGATGIAHSVTDVEAAETQLRRLFGQEAVDKMTGQDVPNDWLSRSDRWITKVGDGFHRFGQGETRGKGEWISKNVVAGIGRLNESAELTTRTLVFKRATELYMEAGHDQATAEKMAANISKNISTNFNRRGNATNVINQLFPFFNAAVQGNARLAETLFEKETYTVDKDGTTLVDQRTKLTPYGKKVASLIGTLGAMQALLLMAAGYDDDEVPKHVKDRAFVIPMPGGTYVAIPMPHGFNLILNAGRELADASVSFATGNYRKMAQHIADGTWGSLAAMSPAGSAGNPVTDWLPALADPFVSIAMNRDAFGRPIAREDMNPLAPTPGFKRAKEGATGTSKALAEGLNWITGGDQDRPGMVSPTPDQIDFLMGFAGGGVAREGMKAAQTAGYVAKGALGIEQEALPLHRVPLIGRVVGNTQSPEVIHQKVFSAAKELNQLQAHYKGLRERGEKEEAAAFKAEHPELALQDDFAKLTRGESKQKKERVKLRGEGEVGKINAMAEKSETRAQELLRRLEEYRAQ